MSYYEDYQQCRAATTPVLRQIEGRIYDCVVPTQEAYGVVKVQTGDEQLRLAQRRTFLMPDFNEGCGILYVNDVSQAPGAKQLSSPDVNISPAFYGAPMHLYNTPQCSGVKACSQNSAYGWTRDGAGVLQWQKGPSCAHL